MAIPNLHMVALVHGKHACEHICAQSSTWHAGIGNGADILSPPSGSRWYTAGLQTVLPILAGILHCTVAL